MKEVKKCIICQRNKEVFEDRLQNNIKYQLSFQQEHLCPDCTDLLNGDIKREDVNWFPENIEEN